MNSVMSCVHSATSIHLLILGSVMFHISTGWATILLYLSEDIKYACSHSWLVLLTLWTVSLAEVLFVALGLLLWCWCSASVQGLQWRDYTYIECPPSSVMAASVHFSLSVREMITGVLWGKMPQEFLFLALNPLGLLDLACIPHPSSLTPGADLLLWLPPAGRHLHDVLPAHGWGGRSLLSCSCPCRALTCPPRAALVSGPSKLGIGPFCSHLVLGFLFQSSAYQKNPHNFSCTGWGQEGREKLRGTQNFPSSYNPTLYFKYLCYIIGHFQH